MQLRRAPAARAARGGRREHHGRQPVTHPAGAGLSQRREADGAQAEVVRRAPFADNPRVGARGRRAQQRILEAALEVFGEAGYDACSVDAITTRAGCSRAAFYQYFSSKEDVFRHLTGEVARRLDVSTASLEPLGPDAAGWTALRAWVARHAAIHERYEPVFHAFQAASRSDDAVATGSLRWSARTVARIRSRIPDPALGGRELGALIMQLLECVTRTHEAARILRSAAPGHFIEDRVDDAMTDVLHRSLFGLRDGVNVRPAPRGRPPALHFDPVVRDAFTQGRAPVERTELGRQTREALLEAGRKVFVERGYHRTRVGDVTEAAGLSHGAFYRYFESKDQLARTLTTRAMQTVSAVLAEIPAAAERGDASGRAALRRWLRRYNLTQAHEAAMLQVWVEAALRDPALRASSAPALDWGRRAMVRFLSGRGFGDVETDALVLVALLSSFGARERTASEVEAAAHVVEQGLLGLRSR